jgi:hypothetical protein
MRLPRLHSLRFGLATNSSSAHSLVFLSQPAFDDGNGAQFGWDHFTAASRARKTDYLALLLLSAARQTAGSQEAAEAITKEWLAVAPSGDYESDRYDYIDHQSIMTLPSTWAGGAVDRTFFEEFKAFLLQDDLAILGGNDNDGGDHPLADGRDFTLPLPRDQGGDNHLVARKDLRFGHWTLFDRFSGTKIRFSLDDRERVAPARASAPELVDVKITDWCDLGCKYCYQGSTVQGRHAALADLDALAQTLADLQVFEVAIGGGEPTMHPDFLAILQAFRRRGIVPNFTTRSLAWLQQDDAPEILATTGAFAFSVNSAAHVEQLVAALDARKIAHSKANIPNIQYVMGSTPLKALGEIAVKAQEENLRLTLLGYKTTGRGSTFKPHDYTGWLALLQKQKVYRTGIDTALAAEYEQEILAAKVPKWMFETVEGRFSMYIDAVEGVLAPSSYCAPEERRQVPVGTLSAADVLLAFKAINERLDAPELVALDQLMERGGAAAQQRLVQLVGRPPAAV